ncbi:heavy-metal-associated domain-containing protein [Microbacterium dauci]|uniref:Heavy-metal-associated domain-containing protein n=1 Tax=Microbacterium dauci TaxID=3048008 RepID=A0ABT6ZH07_9MICO|nr:heavy-metal-associated domain-containing protein [Microbacterium sp. LX3-4]MDJ1115446.1 heavy-metal-associated domain-containing protein [Microbacterium sp. LX3-4]
MTQHIPFGRRPDAAPQPTTAPEGAVSQEVLVTGMTCGHCASSVREELSALDGVASVAIDLTPGGTSRVTVHSAAPLDQSAVEAAVAEAGYQVANA